MAGDGSAADGTASGASDADAGDGSATAGSGPGTASSEAESVESAYGADGTAAADPDADDGDAYGGVVGAAPYAVRASESWLLRAYAVVGVLLTLLVALLFSLGVVVLLGETGGAVGGSFTFSRAFFVFVGFLVVVPLVAPLLFVARRHRRGRGDAGYDATLGALGFGFVASLYVALVISVPPSLRQPADGPLAPVVDALYALPALAGLVPPTAVAVVMWLVARRWRQ
ncbi:hypothetical protein [Halomicrobium urmianum]|uniref:hypothetical protein n=1 Tax=Halomicrobium urmianum TaxID=1586233 RepID=UPI001CD98AFA|nr:hypothetical protein [Halomicrobium urmianum]